MTYCWRYLHCDEAGMLLEMVTLNQSLADWNLKLQQKRQKETLEALGSQVL